MVESLSRRTQRDGDINPFGTHCLTATNGQVREAFSRDDQTEEGPMTEMNRISRFFVNRSSARRNPRIYEWIRANLSLPAGATCLEIGCGSGDMAARIDDRLTPAGYAVTDLARRQLDAASDA